jgi:hypothetical protein
MRHDNDDRAVATGGRDEVWTVEDAVVLSPDEFDRLCMLLDETDLESPLDYDLVGRPAISWRG